MSYLPTSHSYEHTVGLFFLPSIGTEIVYCRGVEHLAADMLTVRPTILTAVPRVLEVIRTRVLTQVARQAPWRQALFHRALELGSQADRWAAADAGLNGCWTCCSIVWCARRYARASAGG